MERPVRHIGQRQKTLRIRCKSRGVAAIEFAIMLPLLVLVFTGMIEYGRLMWHYDVLAKATRDAARYLSMEKTIGNAETDQARTMADNTAAAAGVDDLQPVPAQIAIACDPNCGTPSRVTVSINYGFVIGEWVPIIGPNFSTQFPVTLSPHTTMPYMRNP